MTDPSYFLILFNSAGMLVQSFLIAPDIFVTLPDVILWLIECFVHMDSFYFLKRITSATFVPGIHTVLLWSSQEL